jgi:Flp pilus assembly protein TadG
MKALRLVHKLLRDRTGNAMIVVAATAPLLVAASAIGLDTIQVTLAKRQLQRAADSAAMAGAYSIAQSKTPQSSVTRDLELNNVVALKEPATVENAPTSGLYAGNTRAVRVKLKASRSVPFMQFFTGTSMDIEVEATAAMVFQGESCVISLENTAVTGITFSGSTQVNLGCGVSTNSTATNAVVAGGSSQVVASPIAAVGGVPASSSYIGSTLLLSNSFKQDDPFSALPDPTVPTNCLAELGVQPNQTRTVGPSTPGGTVCYRGMDIKGTLNLEPGVYVIDGGTVSFGATAVVNGVGVTFVLTSSNATSNPASIATLNMHGGAVLNIKAPSTGTYTGVLLYQDRRTPLNNVTINGNTASVYQGAFYLPTQQVTFNGNTGMQTRCIQFVARRMVFSGNSNIQNVCPENEGSKAFPTSTVRLVG